MRESETLWQVAEAAEALMEALMAQVEPIPLLSSLGDGYLTFLHEKSLP